jgi:polysaccharide biosynthesis transport protein
MEIREYAHIARKWLWLFVLATVVAAVSAWVATRFMPRQYRSQTTLLVGRPTASTSPDFQDLYLGRSLAETYAQMASREPVIQDAIAAMGLQTDWQMVKSMVQAAAVPGTQLLEIRVIDTEPNRAQVIANALAASLIKKSPTPGQQAKQQSAAFVIDQQAKLQAQIKTAETEVADLDAKIGLETSARAIADLQNRKQTRQTQIESWRQQYAGMDATVNGDTVNSLAVIEPAAPGAQVGPNVKMNVLLAALIGFGLALGAVLLLEYMDDTVKTAEQAEKKLGLSGLATVDLMSDLQQRKDGLVTILTPRSPTAEAFRTLRTNLQFSLLHQPHDALLVTSANPGEGKSTVAANLAVVTAQSGRRVILVDADLRRPSLHRFFGLTNSLGMTSLLLDPGLTLDDAVQEIEQVPGLGVLTSGPLPPNPAEVLGSPRMADLLERLRERADLAVIDSPPLLVVTDAAVLSTRVSGTVLVVDSGATRTDTARKAVDVLAKVGVKALGVVVNKLNPSTVRGYYYYADRYRYDYGSYYGSSSGGSGTGTGSAGRPSGGRPAGHPAPGWVAKVREAMTSFLS